MQVEVGEVGDVILMLPVWDGAMPIVFMIFINFRELLYDTINNDR
jgi:hypothetical protein